MQASQGLNVIVGLGKTGLSCVRYGLKRKWNIAVTDSSPHPSKEKECKEIAPNIPYFLGGISEELMQRASRLIISPGVSLNHPVLSKAIQRGVPYVGDVELFLQEVRKPIVAVTGSNAKSTVVSLLGEMAKMADMNVQVAGNIGMPVLDLLSCSLADFYVLELSSFQLETIHHLSTLASGILNISEDHMDRYESFHAYLEVKKRIYRHCDVAVVNRTDHRICATLHPDLHVISFGLDEPKENEYGLIETKEGTFLAFHRELLLNINLVKLVGRHNIMNVLAALAFGQAMKIPRGVMLQAVQTFSGLPHRCEWVREVNEVSWYNDSKGTNVGATVAAIEGLKDRGALILIAGGLGKGADFSLLREPVKRAVRKVILLGEAAGELKCILSDCSDVIVVNSLKEAVKEAEKLALPGEQVLLSPACSSLDMFENYECRGDEFKQQVRAL